MNVLGHQALVDARMRKHEEPGCSDYRGRVAAAGRWAPHHRRSRPRRI